MTYFLKRFTPRQKIYFFVIVIGWFFIICPPITANADILGNEIEDVYVKITENVDETNKLLNNSLKLLSWNPFTILNDVGKTNASLESLGIAIVQASKTAALVCGTLLLMMDFFKKSINFEWSSRWENILLFLIKLIVLKVVIQNSDTIIGYIYALFDSLNQGVAAKINPDVGIAFLDSNGGPEKNITYNYNVVAELIDNKKNVVNTLVSPLGLIDDLRTLFKWGKSAVNSTELSTDLINVKYVISPRAVALFYPNVDPDTDIGKEYWSHTNLAEYPFASPVDGNFNPTTELLYLNIYFLIMKLIAYLIYVVIIGRIFELCIYTIIAPLPLCTLASETCQDTAKNFIRNYIAAVIQMAVIATMFVAFQGIQAYILTDADIKGTKMISLVLLISLGVGVAKSGEWSKKAVGAA